LTVYVKEGNIMGYWHFEILARINLEGYYEWSKLGCRVV
jgi:hypothetical protein